MHVVRPNQELLPQPVHPARRQGRNHHRERPATLPLLLLPPVRVILLRTVTRPTVDEKLAAVATVVSLQWKAVAWLTENPLKPPLAVANRATHFPQNLSSPPTFCNTLLIPKKAFAFTLIEC